MPRCDIFELRGGDADYNAYALREVLKGGDHLDARRNSIILNASMAVYVYGLVSSVEEGVALTKQVLASGKALEKLDEWIKVTQYIAKK